MEKRRIQTRIFSWFTVIVTLLPFVQYLFSGITAVAETLEDAQKTVLYQMDQGGAKASYTIDKDGQLDWRIDITKNATDTANQASFQLKAADQVLTATAIQTAPADLFSYTDGKLTEKQADNTAKTITLRFKTQAAATITLASSLLQYQADGSPVDLLADSPAVNFNVSLPQSSTNTTSTTEDTTGSSSTSTTSASQSSTSSTDQQPAATTQADSTSQSSASQSSASQSSTSQSASTSASTSTSLAEAAASTDSKTTDDTPQSKQPARAKQARAADAGRDITTLPGADKLLTSDEGQTIFNTATITKDGQPIDSSQIQINDNILLQYTWSIPEALRKNMQAGDYFDFKLPEKFTIKSDTLTGNLVNDKGIVFGHFTIQKDGSVRIIFTDAVVANSGIKGTLNVAGNVDQTKITNPGDNEIDIPFTDGNTVVVPNIVVPNTQAVSKKVIGQTENNDIKDNQGTVTWELTVNKTGSVMTAGVLTDTLPAGAAYDPASLQVTAYDVDLATGQLSGSGTDVTAEVTASVSGQDVSFTFPTNAKAYVVHFATTIAFDQMKTENGSIAPTAAAPTATVKNNAVLNSKEFTDLKADATATFASASSIKKSDGKYDPAAKVAAWRVDFTKAGMDLPKGTAFSDTMDNSQRPTDEQGNLLSLDDWSEQLTAQFQQTNQGKTIKVVQDSDGKYRLIFPDGISASFTLTYYTSIAGEAGKTYNNSISWNNQGNTGHVSFKQTTLSKKQAGYDPATQKAAWQLSFTKDDNTAGLAAGTTWTDVMNNGQYFVDETGQEITDLAVLSETLTKQLNITNPGKSIVVTKGTTEGSYTLTFPEGVDKSFTLSYYTHVKGEAGVAYNNSINGGKLGDGIGDNVTIDKPKIEKTALSHSLDEDGKNGTAAWRIKVNTNQVKINQWYVKDALKNGTITKDDLSAIKVYEIKKGQTEQTLVPADRYEVTSASDKDFMVTYDHETDSTFIIEYTTHYEIGTDYIKDDETGKFVGNNATLYFNDDVTAGDSGNVSFNPNPDTRQAIGGNKGGSYNSQTNQITWTIAVNTSHLPYGANALLTDPLLENQVYDDSVKPVVTDAKGDPVTNLTVEFVKAGESKTFFGQTVVGGKNGTVVVTGFPEGAKEEYQITFTTKVVTDGDVIAEGTVNNTAYYTDDINLPFTISATVSYADGSKFIDKTHKQNGDMIHYTVTVNPGKYYLRDVKVQDTDWQHIKVDPESIKVYDSRGQAVDKSFYTIDPQEQQFTVTLGQPELGADGTQNTDKNGNPITYIDDQYTIEYDAVILYVGLPGQTIPVTNKVTITGSNVTSTGKEDSDDYEVTVPEAGGTAEGVVHGLKVLKTDSDTGASVAGAEFTLYRGDVANQVKVNTKTTNKNGVAAFNNLTYDTYYLVETAAPAGYYISDELKAGKKIVIDEDSDQVVNVTAKNQQVGSIHVTKIDGETKEKLAGAEFELWQNGQKVTKNALGKELPQLVTDATGELTIENLVPGSYTLKEITAPIGYHVTTSSTAIEVTPGQTEAATIKNEVNKGKLSLKKVAEGKNLAGAEFTLSYTDSNGQAQTIIKTTDKDGLVSFELEANKIYSLKETKNPYGYSGSWEITNIRVIGDNQVLYDQNDKKDQTVTNVPLEVKNKLITTEISGTKVWDLKGNDRDLVQPDSIVVTLYRKDHTGKTEPVDQQTVSNASNWSYRFTDLPKYDLTAKEETAYLYTVKENQPGYTTSISGSQTDGFTITNTVKTTNVTGTKTWDDLAEKYGLIPDQLTINLEYSLDGQSWQAYKQNGQALTATATKEAGWSYSFTDLPTTDKAGTKIHYRVTESALTGFTAIAKDYDLYNKLATTKLSVEKTWDDEKNFYETRPNAVTFTLMVKKGSDWQTFEAVFGVKKVLNVTADDDWKGTFTELPQYDAKGEKISYAVKETLEDSQPTYHPNGNAAGTAEKQIEAAQGATVNFTNELTKVAVTVAKTWQDFDDRFNTRPEKITFELQAWADGQTPADAKTIATPTHETGRFDINGPDFAPLTITNLPKYNKAGDLLHYQVVEVAIQKNYSDTPAYSESGNSLTIENILDVTNITIHKEWDDQGNLAAERPKVTLQLFRQVNDQLATPMTDKEGTKNYIQTIEAGSTDTAWSYTFANLPAKDKAGNTYTYSVKETSQDVNYTAEQVADLTVKNTLKTKAVTVTKHWDDQDNRFASRPAEVSFALYYIKNGKEIAFKDAADKAVVETVEVKGLNDWTHTFANLPAYHTDGSEYEYVVHEIVEKADQTIYPNYEADDNGLEMTNKLLTTSVSGTKTWDDQDDQFGTRPEVITVQLYQNDTALTGDDFTKEVSAKDGWKYEFTDLPQVDQTGKAYVYTVKEVATAKNYEATETGMDITNTLITTSVSGHKIWEDGNDQDQIRPAAITVVLYQNGKKLLTTEATEKSDWAYEFVGLPKVDQTGKTYVYTVKEADVPNGYQASVHGYDITNSHTPTTPNKPEQPKTPNKPATQHRFPKTNDQIQYGLLILGVLIILGAAILYFRRKRA